jgi:hypothetical protein
VIGSERLRTCAVEAFGKNAFSQVSKKKKKFKIQIQGKILLRKTIKRVGRFCFVVCS